MPGQSRHILHRTAILVALLGAASVAGSLTIAPSFAQQQPQKHAPAKPPAKAPPKAAAKPPGKPDTKEAKDTPTEPMTPSQIGIPTVAKQAYLVDVNTGTVLLAKDADTPMKPSSMAKMMTVYLLWEEMKAGRVNLDTQYRVSEAAWRMQGSKMFVDIDSLVAVRDLIPGIIVHSGNDAAVVVAEGISGSQDAFAQRMNKKAKEFGMKNTTFMNADGWPDDKQFTTAHDLAILAQHTIQDFPDYYKEFYAQRSFKYKDYRSQSNRNELLGRVDGVDGLKTGHTEEAGFGLTASAIRGGRRVILVVNGLLNKKAREQEPERLIEWAFREFEDYTLFKPGEVVSQADVWMGVAPKVQLTVTKDAVMTLPRGARQNIKVSVVYDGPVKAPIRKGQQIGKLVVSGDNLQAAEIPLVAAEDVEKMGFLGRIVSGVKYFVLGQHS